MSVAKSTSRFATPSAEPNGAATKAAPARTPTAVDIPPLDLREVELVVVGTSPLICNRWADKAKRAMLDKQTGKATRGKQAKDPEEDFINSLYEHPEGGYGFPAIAFKAAAVRAGTYSDQKMTYLRGAFHIVGGELVRIEGDPTPREDMVRVGMGIADIRYRGEFKTWKARLPIRFNTRAISLDQLVMLFRIAGFSVGIGEWRPERDGSYGMFEVGGA